MEDFQVGIIGGRRGMGRWFADYLMGQGYTVHVSGSKTGMSVAEMAACCKVVVVSVPIGITCDIISQVGPLMDKDSLLMDLTSLKADPVQAMLKHSRSEVIGCHPLFGPKIDNVENQHVVICPARTGKWLSWLVEVWKKGGALLVETTPEKHDEYMSVVQVLNHFNTIMMGMALSKTSAPLSQLDRFTTPIFDTKAKLVKKIFNENPRLYAEILCDNPRRMNIVESYEQAIAEMKAAILRGDADEVTELIQKAAIRLWPDEKERNSN